MTFKCKKCGWTPEQGSFYETVEDIQIIIKHDKICPDRTIEGAKPYDDI